MKKYIATAVILMSVAAPAFASVVVPVVVPEEPVIIFGNGPIVAQLPGGRFLKPGQEDCPAWFPYSGCYTFNK